ncbi:MAG TPA: hypothetical protein VIG51_02675 [Candidatus Baltobacteraceae bacterium]|jgi:hypothetical protein
MKKVLPVLLVLALAACGGGGGGTGTSLVPQNPSPNGPSATGSANARESVSFRVPMATASLSNPTPASSHRKAAAARKPMYISPDTAQATLIVDGTPVRFTIATKSPSNANGTTSSATIPIGTQGEQVSYTTTAVQNGPGGAGYYQITMTFDLFPGAHTFGVALQAADGFVLSEGQSTYTLNGGSNPAATLSLKGVADSAFLCNWPDCNGTVGTPAADGTYSIMAFASDHEGDAIVQQKDASGAVVPLANGPISMVETDSNHIVTIGNPGPFTDAGGDTTMHNGYASLVPTGWLGGHLITIKCNAMGSTKVAMELGSTSPAAGAVTGFDYTAPIDITKDPVDPSNGQPFPTPQTSVWTTPGQIIGSVPTFQDFGNQLSVNCDANFNLTLN